MADIELQRDHSLGINDGRAAVQHVADDLQEVLNASYNWDGNTLHFKGSGASGNIEVAESQIRVNIDLNFLLRPMRSQVEAEAERYLDRHLG
jgi:putative polyhydroxyalkanoate system protein